MCNILHDVHITGASRLFICIRSMAFTEVASFVDKEKYLCCAVIMFINFLCPVQPRAVMNIIFKE